MGERRGWGGGEVMRNHRIEIRRGEEEGGRGIGDGEQEFGSEEGTWLKGSGRDEWGWREDRPMLLRLRLYEKI